MSRWILSDIGACRFNLGYFAWTWFPAVISSFNVATSVLPLATGEWPFCFHFHFRWFQKRKTDFNESNSFSNEIADIRISWDSPFCSTVCQYFSDMIILQGFLSSLQLTSTLFQLKDCGSWWPTYLGALQWSSVFAWHHSPWIRGLLIIC